MPIIEIRAKSQKLPPNHRSVTEAHDSLVLVIEKRCIHLVEGERVIKVQRTSSWEQQGLDSLTRRESVPSSTFGHFSPEHESMVLQSTLMYDYLHASFFIVFAFC